MVGAGSAGCVLAARLSEDPSVRVALLEAGGPASAREVAVPIAFAKLFRTEFDWNFRTEPEPALGGRRAAWPRGRMLGGSSSLNAMIYMRGNPADYDGWLAAGNEGWGFADVLPWFRRSENNSRGESRWHGVGGPLDVQDLRYHSVLTDAMLTAALQRGHKFNDDFNAASQLGVGHYQVTQKNGRRASALTAFLAPAQSRPNLSVLTGAQVRRVLVEGGRAVGAEFVRDGRLQVLRVAREVILAAGTIGSPQLLMLSGVGPADHLHSLDIPVVVDAPNVGMNLSDHFLVGAAWFTEGRLSYNTADNRRNLFRYLAGRRGPFTSNLAEAGGFLRIEGSGPPDIQLLFAPAAYLRHGEIDPPAPCYGVGAYLLTPASRGRVSLRSADSSQPPVIEANYLQEQSDRERVRAAARHCVEIGEAPALARYRKGRFLPDSDGPLTDDVIDANIRQWGETVYHPVGTAAMGPGDDAVVDPALRVRGVECLRVVDASVFPTVPRGNTNAPVIMVAEKAVELIRAYPAGQLRLAPTRVEQASEPAG